MQNEQFLDQVAIEAMKELIAKFPMIDTEGEFGKEKSKEELDAIKEQLCKSAYGYAYWMLKAKEWFRQYVEPQKGGNAAFDPYPYLPKRHA